MNPGQLWTFFLISFRLPPPAFRLPRPLFSLCLLSFLLIFSGCGKDSKKENYKGYPNVGGGYTLVVSGGTLNDGSGENGLVILATLRDENSYGPGLNGGWQITITGPGFTLPPVDYDDGSPSSYLTWRWKGIQPPSGTYTAEASNGTTTLTYNFSINAASTLNDRPALTKKSNTISWQPVNGASSYYYKVTTGTEYLVDSDYRSTSQTSFQLPGLSDGSYLIEVFALTKNRFDLMSDPSSWPSLPSQENNSVSAMDLLVSGGIPGSYDLTAKGGVLYEGRVYSDETGTVDRYGLVIWTSILTDTGVLPAGDWTISVTGPNISSPIVFDYPRYHSHYVYWEFDTLPAAGNYTVIATPATGDSLSTGFTIPSPGNQLPLAIISSVTPAADEYTVNWTSVTGALSYYVNLWTCVGDGSENTPDGCTNGGIYSEVTNLWADGSTALILKSSLIIGKVYDVYVTACTLDMTTTNSTSPPDPAQVDMSDTTFTYATFTAQ